MASVSFLKRVCSCIKAQERVRKWIAKTLTLRPCCRWGICVVGCEEKKKNRRESQRERERANNDCGKLFVERRFLALQSCSPLYLLHLFSCNFRLVKQEDWIQLGLWYRLTAEQTYRRKSHASYNARSDTEICAVNLIRFSWLDGGYWISNIVKKLSVILLVTSLDRWDTLMSHLF